MKLYEFFGNFQFDSGKDNEEDRKIKEEDLADQVFEFIINNDRLQKTEFFPIAERIFNEATKEQKSSVWLPMVNKGCMEFYRFKEMKENPQKVFDKELRERICNKMSEHYQSDILKGAYRLGK
jgi:hypothetical protein